MTRTDFIKLFKVNDKIRCNTWLNPKEYITVISIGEAGFEFKDYLNQIRYRYYNADSYVLYKEPKPLVRKGFWQFIYSDDKGNIYLYANTQAMTEKEVYKLYFKYTIIKYFIIEVVPILDRYSKMVEETIVE